MRQAWAALLAGLCVSGATLTAQAARTFKARLSPVPIDLTMQATIAGSGTATATLNGTKLTIAGTFEGLKSPATIAKVHKSPVRGVRGPEILDLTITAGVGATSGTIGGTFNLSPQQAGDLQSGRLYIQIHSEKAPDGNLWGWLLKKK